MAPLNKKGFFITGTDTNAGKTTIALALLQQLKQRGAHTVALKPVSAGCVLTEEGLRNEDALLLQQAATIKLPYSQINPYAFALPTSPHIAAEKVNQPIKLTEAYAACQPVFTAEADYIIVEGAGGWFVPINHTETMADLAHLLALPIILVVGMRLGCFNHTLLTAAAIQKEKLPLVGWVANTLDPNMVCFEEYIFSLQNYLSAPLLGVVPFFKRISINEIQQCLDLTKLNDFL